MSTSQNTESPSAETASQSRPKSRAVRFLLQSCIVLFGLMLTGVLILVFALTMAYPNLPEIDAITSYRPKMPMRVFSADNMLIAEFGE